VETQGQALIEAWDGHFARLKQLPVGGDASEAALSAFAEWVRAPDGDNPASQLLQMAQQEYSRHSAQRHAEIAGRRKEREDERTALEDERARLEGGEDAAPPAPHTREASARIAREGAPLLQLVDFKSSVSSEARAGLEAALEASGLLDAWVSPSGRLQVRRSITPGGAAGGPRLAPS
jgi:hypothetical protein